ncbi:MAG TPA: DUF4397 domain-containing protein [Candidatus Limnocylindria bacterium]|nr:DUF4397 domain-containing protein [Candidatus Limnocylindria bacterium]
MALSLLSLLLISAMPVAADGHDARVRVLHASPDAPAVDVYLNDEIVDALTNVPFGVISGYLNIPAGEQNFKVYPTGDTTTAVIDADVTLEAGTSYTVAAINPVASIEPAVFVDNPSLDYDTAQVRVVHLSPDAPAIDVAPDGADPADAVVMGLEFPDATDYLALPGGEYDLEVRLAGETTVALQLDPIEIQDGGAYSVFAIGSAAAEPLGGNALTALIAEDGRILPDTSTVTEPGAAASMPLMLIAALAMGAATFVLLIGRGRFASETR